jgi:hypothetical protein
LPGIAALGYLAKPMRALIAAAVSAAVLLVGFFGAPLVPVLAGAAVAGAWLVWRARAGRRPG